MAGRECSICAHGDRAAIDTAIVSNIPIRTIATQYRISTGAINRHKSAHVSASAKAQGLTAQERHTNRIVKAEADYQASLVDRIKADVVHGESIRSLAWKLAKLAAGERPDGELKPFDLETAIRAVKLLVDANGGGLAKLRELGGKASGELQGSTSTTVNIVDARGNLTDMRLIEVMETVAAALKPWPEAGAAVAAALSGMKKAT